MPDLKTIFQIDHTSKLPLYELIEENFRQLILSEKLKIGDPIPPEEELSECYGVSRMTVHHALGDLARQGWIVRRQGIGTFVKTVVSTRIAPSMLSFTEQMRAIGRTPSSRIVAIQVIPASGEIAGHLNIHADEPVIKLTRIRMADGDPILLESTYLSQAHFPGLENANVLETQSLYEYLDVHYGAKVVTMDQTLEPVLLSSTDAALLEAEPASPAILSEIIAYGSDRRPIEYSWSVTSSAKCKFYFSFRRGENAGQNG